jgi:hypothetical protein
MSLEEFAALAGRAIAERRNELSPVAEVKDR